MIHLGLREKEFGEKHNISLEKLVSGLGKRGYAFKINPNERGHIDSEICYEFVFVKNTQIVEGDVCEKNLRMLESIHYEDRLRLPQREEAKEIEEYRVYRTITSDGIWLLHKLRLQVWRGKGERKVDFDKRAVSLLVDVLSERSFGGTHIEIA